MRRSTSEALSLQESLLFSWPAKFLFLRVKQRNFFFLNLYNITFHAKILRVFFQQTQLSTSSDIVPSWALLRGTHPGPAGIRVRVPQVQLVLLV